MKKKIAILTQPLGLNYGGIVQNYALQRVLQNLGYETETLSREGGTPAWRLMIGKFKNATLNRLIGAYSKIFSQKELAVVASHMNVFIKTYMKVSKPLRYTKDLRTYFYKQSFDGIVVGSDQTWRPQYSPGILNYFLDFLENDPRPIKISYSASFGVDLWEFSKQDEIVAKRLLPLFDAVSVREHTGVTLCKEYLDLDVELVLDPTMLLGPEDYAVLFKNADYEPKGLFNYVLDADEYKQDYITKASSLLGLKSFKTSPTRSIYSNDIFYKLDEYIYPPIEHWLKSFHNASFIITDSFHGTVFSILFNKPFVAIVNQSRGATRFRSLLAQFGLEDRLVTDATASPLHLLNMPIDYIDVNKKLVHLRQQSLQFLQSNLPK